MEAGESITGSVEASKLRSSLHRSLHYRRNTDFCLSVDEEVGQNSYGIVNKVIPACRCAWARDVGSRSNNKAAAYLYEAWLPHSGESVGSFPIFFHYVNVGPKVRDEDMITDVYLPLK